MIITPRSPSGPVGVFVVMYGSVWRIKSSVPRRFMLRTKSMEEMSRGVFVLSIICEAVLVMKAPLAFVSV
jgi:hypothetical protein